MSIKCPNCHSPRVQNAVGRRRCMDCGNVWLLARVAKTNFDAITSSPEALAEFIDKTTSCGKCPVFRRRICRSVSECKTLIKEWLNQEAEGVES